MTPQERIKKIREKSGLQRKEFADYFDIPYRTLQEWELANRIPPEYVLDLLEYKVEHEFSHKEKVDIKDMISKNTSKVDKKNKSQPVKKHQLEL